MKVLVCGDRYWNNRILFWVRLTQLPEGTVIIHGNAAGADTLAADVAKRHGFEVIAFPADWKRYGRAAGPIRNRQMLDEKPDLVIAFHNNLSKSKGTKDCVEEAERRGIDIEIISEVPGFDYEG
jgi:hypothetical protein